jgi:hypothetical protein
MATTEDRNDPRLKETRADGQREAHIVLPDNRMAGFIRPVRTSYRHVGRQMCLKPHVKEDGSEIYCTDKPGHEGECTIWTTAEWWNNHNAAEDCGNICDEPQLLWKHILRNLRDLLTCG